MHHSEMMKLYACECPIILDPTISNVISNQEIYQQRLGGARARCHDFASLLVKKHFTVSSRYSRRDWLGRGRKGAPRRLKFHDKRPLQRRKVNFPWRSSTVSTNNRVIFIALLSLDVSISRWTRFENRNDRNKYVERPRRVIFFFLYPPFSFHRFILFFESRVICTRVAE